MDVLSIHNIKNEYDYLVTIYGESRGFEEYLLAEYTQVYDKDLNCTGWWRKEEML